MIKDKFRKVVSDLVKGAMKDRFELRWFSITLFSKKRYGAYINAYKHPLKEDLLVEFLSYDEFYSIRLPYEVGMNKLFTEFIRFSLKH